MNRPLTPEFFDRPATEIAQDLLGKFLIRKYNDHEWVLMITEVEAYDGPYDKASIAYNNRTDQTEPMFAYAGVFCIWPQRSKKTLQDFFNADRTDISASPTNDAQCMLTIVAGPKDYPAAILVRSALVMLPTGEIEHIESPEAITRFLKIGNEFHGMHIEKDTYLWLEDRDITIPQEHIVQSKRIGVDHAAEWSELLHNFSIKVSRSKDSTE